MSATGARYRHPELGFEVELFPGAEVLPEIPGVALVAVEGEPEPSSGFRANLAVTVEPVPAGAAVGAYTDASLAVQDDALLAHRLLDREQTALAGAAATRTLGHHIVDDQSVTIEQWRVLLGGRAYTLTASCATLDYAGLADTLREAAESFRPEAGP